MRGLRKPHYTWIYALYESPEDSNNQPHGEDTYHHTYGNLYVRPWRENKRQRPGLCFDAKGDAVPAEFRGGLRAS